MSNSSRILILGGTSFIGPHFVRAALNRDYKVTVLARGHAHAELPSAVERLSGDRNGALDAIADRDWDAVFDLAAYVPNWVRTLGTLLRSRVEHYTFISTIVAYRDLGAADEHGEVQQYVGDVDPYSLRDSAPGAQYGALKALCEIESERQFPQRALIVRPGCIVGPGDRVGALTYLIARLQQGGEVFVCGNPLTQIQLLDVRDLAEWVVLMMENRTTGVFNAAGPALPLGWAELLGSIRAVFSVPTRLTWGDESWLANRQVGPFSCMRFWPGEVGQPGFMRLRNEKARTNGLVFRPLAATIADTLAWYDGLHVERRREVTLGFDQLNQPLEYSMEREVELLAAWKADSMLRA